MIIVFFPVCLTIKNQEDSSERKLNVWTFTIQKGKRRRIENKQKRAKFIGFPGARFWILCLASWAVVLIGMEPREKINFFALNNNFCLLTMHERKTLTGFGLESFKACSNIQKCFRNNSSFSRLRQMSLQVDSCWFIQHS